MDVEEAGDNDFGVRCACIVETITIYRSWHSSFGGHGGYGAWESRWMLPLVGQYLGWCMTTVRQLSRRSSLPLQYDFVEHFILVLLIAVMVIARNFSMIASIARVWAWFMLVQLGFMSMIVRQLSHQSSLPTPTWPCWKFSWWLLCCWLQLESFIVICLW